MLVIGQCTAALTSNGLLMKTYHRNTFIHMGKESRYS